MGKRTKKKAGGVGQKGKEKVKEKEKEKRVSEVGDVGSAALLGERNPCVHFDKAVDIGTVTSAIESAHSTVCQDCRESVCDRKSGKPKGKHAKKKPASDSRPDKPTWICLQCAHFACGGIGLPTSPQSHALRHSRLSRHPLVIQMQNPLLIWCFSCKTLIPVDNLEDSAQQKDVLLDIIKLLKKQSSQVSPVDVEDVWFGSGSAVSDVKAQSKSPHVTDAKEYYAIRGLTNLGNTCFFNSVMQNLLAMDILREHFLKFEGSMGPLTSALNKLFIETSPDSGLRSVINPRSLFGCVCAKAPQFRGYQQHDSHELLRYLLDGLSSEDLCAKKSVTSSPENGRSVPASATFVDAIFGGQTSSTVCCVECGHSSVVYEPFLDLSLSVPTKKPLSKQVQPVSRAKKTKLPPKRGGKTFPKLNRYDNLEPSPSNGTTSTNMESSPALRGDLGPAPSSCNVSTSAESSGLNGESLSCVPSVGSAEPSNVAHRNALMTQDSNTMQPDYASVQVLESADQDAGGMTWMDFLEPKSQSDGVQEAGSSDYLDYLESVPLSDDLNSAENEVFSVPQDPGSHIGNQNTASTEDRIKPNVQTILSQDSTMIGDNYGADSAPDTAKSGGEVSAHPEDVNLNSESTVDDWGDERPIQVKDNEILLLTYKEDGPIDGEGVKVDAEISLPAVVDGEDPLGFDGLGDLFNEPEVMVTGVSNNPVCEPLSNGFLAGNSTESDPDEVDDTDSPVSVESCLAHFIKPELLSGEHAWHCENCSKLLKEKRLRMRKNHQKAVSIQRNMFSDVCSSSEVFQELSQPFSDSSAVFMADHDNGSSDTDGLKKLGAGRINGLCPNFPPEEEKGCVPETTPFDSSGPAVCSSSSGEAYLDGKSDDSHGMLSNHGPVERPSVLCAEHRLGEDEEEEVDSKCVMVTRDATKRILISKTPPVLTVHLKRFGQDARGRLSKLNGHVGFKEYIDLGPYMDGRSAERDNCIYHLVGVVEHSGSMRGGHYVAYVRGGDRRGGRSEESNRQGNSVWYHVSDAYVREITLEEVLGSEAYILFYEKVKS